MSNYCKTIVVLSASLIITCTAIADVPEGGVLFVDDDAEAGGDGLTWNTAYHFLQDALTTASQGGISEIHIAQGNYKPDRNEVNPDGTGDREATFQLVNKVSLMGGYAGIGAVDPDARDFELYETILSGDLLGNDGEDFENNSENSYHVLVHDVPGEPAELEGFTISEGNADGEIFLARGGGLFIFEATCIINSCRFTNNSANGSGGGIKIISGGSLQISASHFENNRAIFFPASQGGALNSDNSELWAVDCHFQANEAKNGGAVTIDGSSGTSTLEACTFFGNTVVNKGGGLFIVSGDALVIDCVFFENEAIGRGGGGLYTQSHQSVMIVDCNFVNNIGSESASDDFGGGGVHINVGNSNETVVSGCYFSGNSALQGPGLFNADNDGVILNCVFENNLGLGADGGIRNSESSDVIIANCRFINNVGSGMRNSGHGDPSIINCQFIGNNSGGLLHGPSDGPVINCLFVGNSIDSIGGGVQTGNGSSSLFLNCAFLANTAGDSGGGMIIRQSNITIIGCTFVANVALNSGDGILVEESSNAFISNSIFWNNSDNKDEASQISIERNSSIDINYSCVQGLTGSLGGIGNIGDDPLFVDVDGPDDVPGTEDDDYSLSTGSPCIDAGNNWGVPKDANDYDEDSIVCELFPADLNGNPRFNADEADFDPGCGIPVVVDMGAYEYQFDPVGQVTFADLNADGSVSTLDLLSLFAEWGECVMECCLADLDLDGNVNTSDLLILFANWGSCE